MWGFETKHNSATNWQQKTNPKGQSPSLGVNKVARTTHNCAKELKRKPSPNKKKTFRKYFGLQKWGWNSNVQTKQKDKSTIWKPLGLFVLFIWFWYGISLAALQKGKKKYIYIYTDLSLHRMALVKGYIFPLQLKINKMVSNIPPQYYFYFLLVFQVNRKSFFLF